MKKFFSLFLAVLLIFSCWTAATAESIDAVSGATVTTKGITKGANAALAAAEAMA